MLRVEHAAVNICWFFWSRRYLSAARHRRCNCRLRRLHAAILSYTIVKSEEGRLARKGAWTLGLLGFPQASVGQSHVNILVVGAEYRIEGAALRIWIEAR